MTVAAAGLIGGCARAPVVAPEPPEPPPQGATVVSIPAKAEPSPLLQLVRRERNVSELRYAPIVVGSRAEADEAVADEEANADEGEVRTVMVKTTRFATWESLARAALRFAENRRPRELHESRLLLRVTQGTTSCGASVADKATFRRVLREQRPNIKRCLIEAQTRRDEIVVKAPSALVVEQAMRHGDVVLRFDVATDGAGEATISDDGALDEPARECLARAFSAALPDEIPAMRVPVLAFAQAAQAYGGGPLNRMLADEAATLGWRHYDRGEFHEALAFFEDAYWIFHRVEYQVLVGMALEHLDRPVEAAAAYAQYVSERPDAPDTLRLRLKIAVLRRA